jgi:predicted dehydrogenase
MTIDQSRRGFLRRTASMAGAGVIAAGLSPRAAVQAFSANERVNVGMIGLGGMGTSHLTVLTILKEKLREPVEVVAVCDVFSKRLETFASKTGAKPYKMWSDLLADKQVDAVLIATPDHWHAPLTLAALDAGKDVYCEKPMTHFDHLDLARKVVETVAKGQRVMQVGTQLLQEDCWRLARENVGSLGKIVHVQDSDCRNGWMPCYLPKETADPDAVPGKTLDWDMWLGCEKTRVPKRPYDPRRFFAFRGFWDYSGGIGTDQFPHTLSPWVKLLDLGFPKRVVTAGGQYYYKDGREVPDIVQTCIDYEGGPTVSLLGTLASARKDPGMIRGQKAAMVITGESEIRIVPEKEGGGGEPTEIKGREAMPLMFHWRDFLNGVRTRNKPVHNEVIGYRIMVALSMGVKSYRSGKALGFDAPNDKIKES